MNIDEMTVGQIKEINSMFNSGASTEVASTEKSGKEHKYHGRKVLVRSYASGVHIGIMGDYSDRAIFLNDSQRIHQWGGAFTLSKVATSGIKSGRISCIVNEIYIEQVEEIILLTEEAIKSINEVGIHNE